MQNKPFHLTRWRLAVWYTGSMSIILALSGFAIYRLIAHAHWLHLTKSIQDLAHQLEDQIEPALKQPGQLEPDALLLLPGLCMSSQNCTELTPQPDRSSLSKVEKLYQLITQNNYCIRFLSLSQQTVATLHFPQTNSICNNPNLWQQKHDGQGHYYHLASYPLETEMQADWGEIQIARSLDNLDIYLFRIELILVAIIFLAIALAGVFSWWLAGLVMQPILQSYEQMEQFTADAAHELCTPLTTLRAIVQTAIRSEDLSADTARETLYIVNRQSSRLSKLVQDLLMLCQIDKVKPTQLSACCMNTIIQELMDEFAAIALSSSITISAEIKPDPLLYVEGDTEQLYRAISNLLSNAIRYTPEGGQVTVTLKQHSTYAIVQVQDTGIGISLEDQSKIFNRFYRVEQGRSQERGGAGLGLAIVQAIVQTHRGCLKVHSEMGKGSIFTIQLPLLNINCLH